MPVSDRWFAKSSQFHGDARQGSSSKNNYNNGILEMQKDYEDPEYYYSRPPELPQKPTPPPLPPMNSLQKIIPTHLVIEHKQRNECNSKLLSLGCLLATVTILFIISLAYFLAWEPKNDANLKTVRQSLISDTQGQQYAGNGHTNPVSTATKSKMDIEVTPSFLLTLLITKRKLCLFEASTDRIEESTKEYREEHIESARLLRFANLSEDGIPVHPLQFQRYARSLGVDADCYVIIYDRGEVIWATHALWIFTLFGHPKVALYPGGISEWKKLKANSAQYKTESGVNGYSQRNGHFRAQWNSAVICTFDDVLTNTELKTHDLVDAQDRDQYEGVSPDAVYGHIRSAVNIPAEEVYNWHEQAWLDESYLKAQFQARRLNETRPVIVYSATAIRSSLTWFALRKCGYNSSIYFGSWPEWLIRAPEFLKVIPKKKL